MTHDVPGRYSCAYWHWMDRKFATERRSPLHHDQRCTECLLTEHARAKAVPYITREA